MNLIPPPVRSHRKDAITSPEVVPDYSNIIVHIICFHILYLYLFIKLC